MLPVLLALVVGAIAAYAALAVVAIIDWLNTIGFGAGADHLYSAAAGLPRWRVVLVPAAGGLLVGLLMIALVPERRYHGPADVMEAVRVGEGQMDLRAGVSSALASALAIGSGASLGRYGPSVHLGASIAAALGQLCRLVRAERLTLIGCGVAAAISASFSAPLAGVLFAHEVVLDAFARRGFVAITIASVTGQVVARAHDASFTLSTLEAYRIEYSHEYLLFALVGVLGGAVAMAFVAGLRLSLDAGARLKLPLWVKTSLGGALVGFVALLYPQVLGLGDEAIHDAVAQLFPLPLLITLLVAKLVLACACRGLSLPGGVFAPALFLGAMLGSAVGQAIHWLDPSLVGSIPVYTVAGMGAVVSCVIGSPIATILIVFELTNSYSLTTAVMIAVVVAAIVTGRVFPYSWFNLQLAMRGVDVRVGREVRIMRSRRVRELVSPDFHRVSGHATLAEARDDLMQHQAAEMLVVDADGVLCGQVSLIDILAGIEAGRGAEPVTTIASMPGVILNIDEDLDSAIQALRYFAGVSVPVVGDRAHMRIEGVVFASSVIGAYNDAVEQARREERGAN